jgi:hypothetical protein
VRVAIAIALLLASAVTTASLAAEDAEPAEPTAGKTEPTTEQKPTWTDWISSHAYDPIRRCWVPIPEGVEPGPETGYIWNLGRWELVKLVQREGRGWGYYDHRGKWHGRDEDRTTYRVVIWKPSHYEETLPRKSFEERALAKQIKLEPADAERLNQLFERRVIAEMLLDDASDTALRGEAAVSHDVQDGVVSLSGRAELVARIATLITDDATYRAVTTEQPHGNVVEIISLVDLAWLDREPEAALDVAELTLAGLERLVQARSDQYRRLHKALWFNATYGTVTIIDHPDTIPKIREYLDAMPYGPKPERMTSAPGR